MNKIKLTIYIKKVIFYHFGDAPHKLESEGDQDACVLQWTDVFKLKHKSNRWSVRSFDDQAILSLV